MAEASARGKVILVTGSTDGIGKETALELAIMGARVLIHGRNREKGQAVLDEIRKKSGNDGLELFIDDLSSQRQVHRLAEEVLTNHDRLDVLINNAGVYMKERKLTEDGLETTFAVNYLAPFLLTNLLLDLLKRSSPSRVINVSSIAHRSGAIQWDNLQGEEHFDGYEAYAASKLELILFTYALARRLKGTGVTINCLHPGVINTKLLRAGFGMGGASVQEGARTSVYLATSPDVEKVSGEYFEAGRRARSSSVTYDQALQEEFWRIGERLTGLARRSP